MAKMGKVTKLIVHCSATPEGRPVTVQEIDTWHKKQGWTKIGYHWVIYLDGSVHKGRDEGEQGAHTIGQNANSIGVCYIGGCAKDGLKPKDTRTPEQKAALIRLLKDLKQRYPGVTIHGHREFANKACPSFDAKTEYENL